MFCTTECWNCEDKNCEHYISKQELYFENQQLKEKIKWYEKENKHNQEIVIKDTKVLDEIRECVNEPWMVADYNIQQQINKQKQYLLQILDKVKE